MSYRESAVLTMINLKTQRKYKDENTRSIVVPTRVFEDEKEDTVKFYFIYQSTEVFNECGNHFLAQDGFCIGPLPPLAICNFYMQHALDGTIDINFDGYHVFEVCPAIYDMDECKYDHGCSHKCVNTPGSYFCTCSDDYINDKNDISKCARICTVVGGLLNLRLEQMRLDVPGKCPVHMIDKGSWKEAIFGCSQYGAYIAERNMLNEGRNRDGTFIWTDGSPLSYSDWKSSSSVNGVSEPSGGVYESCSIIRLESIPSTDNWHDVPCGTDLVYQHICKAPIAACDGFRYYDNKCLPSFAECDGMVDCQGAHHEDEHSLCDEYTYHCPGAYRCIGESQCVSMDQRCDGIKQCQAGDDEMLCDIVCPDGCSCHGYRFSCLKRNWVDLPDNMPTSVRRLYSDRLYFCCLANERRSGIPLETCYSPRDAFSSCHELMASEVLRVFLWVLGISALLGNIFVILWRLRDRRERLRLSGALSMVSSEVSVYILSVITLDRFICIVFPFSGISILVVLYVVLVGA
uniref:Uncharacterized protein LOC100369023 n=1 Tax=Saccoglossus kowalevskii TaxID=10224 RepID=A0ABM0M459_SACKO|nr:PREDICTED: uncharacterized protein LOC100369023 [Saccoglossus kowalevskii]